MEKREKKRVAVIFGGVSYEREISVLTGVFVLNVLKGEYDLIPVYIDRSGDFYTSEKMLNIKTFQEGHTKDFTKISFTKHGICRYGKGKILTTIDCALNCCHGGWGEGGGLSALLELYDIPLASPDMPRSAIFMDKTLTKRLISGMGILSAQYLVVTEENYRRSPQEIEEKISALGDVILKPARLGSSIGISVVKNREELPQKLQQAFRFDQTLLVEEYLPQKRDINCAAYACNGEFFVSECEEPLSAEEILSFREKYLDGGKIRRADFPAKIPPEVSAEIKLTTERLYKELQFSGMVRADYILSGGKVYFNELNTVPGSLAYYLFTPKIGGAKKLFSALIEEGMKRNAPLPLIPPTGILQKTTLTGFKK
jgi:D-alanine-D-alanine ligase